MYSKDSIYKVYKRGISKEIPNRDEILRYDSGSEMKR